MSNRLHDWHLRAGEAVLAGIETPRAAIADLGRTVGRMRTIETRLSLLLLNARGLVFRSVSARSPERDGCLSNCFYGADADMIGRSEERVVHLDQDAWHRRVHPDDLPAYCAAEGARWSFDAPYVIEYRIQHAVTGELRWVRECAWVDRDPLTGERLFDSYLLDITGQKGAEVALRAREERYRTLVEGQEHYVCCCSRDLAVTFVNESLCRRLGRTRDELIGAAVTRVITPEEAADGCAARLASLSLARPAITYECTVHEPDRGLRWEEWTDRAVFDGAGVLVEYRLIGRDITERKRAGERILHLAFHDAVTDLPNRRLFQDRLRQALARAHRDAGRVAVLMLDLDDFKGMNDRFGHPFGDRLLAAMATRLSGLVRTSDTVARLGGDEFAVLLTGVRDHRSAALRADEIRRSLAEPFVIGGVEAHSGASIGIALYPDDAKEADVLIELADAALVWAKQHRRGRCCFHRGPSAATRWDLHELERDLPGAFGAGQFLLDYQPRFEAQSRRCVGFEALVRWHHPVHGVLQPAAFMPLAEESPLIHELGAWILERACARSAAWRAAGRPHVIAVNLSPRQILHAGVLTTVARALSRADLPPHDLELEITETTILDSANRTLATKLGDLAELGVRLSIDDFGTGYASLAHLSRLPIHTIKIDRTFVGNIGRSRADEAIIRSVIGLAHNLGRRVVAEGVETAVHLEFVQAEACDEVQGFFLGPPAPEDDAARYLDG